MTELEKFEAAFAALPPLPEEVRATVLVIWLEVVSGNVDLPTLRELCVESLAQLEGNCADAMLLNLVDQLIAHSGVVRHPPHSAHDTNGADIERISVLVRGSVRAGAPRDVRC